ncbi:MAG: hypothetical protein ISS79_03900 [Phycisphaerae bacterium]|nr:hypothetical protein [Phycisphaerae bacterium]
MATIICLANSYKPGGSCIAGIDPETGKWIRPVPDTKDRAITWQMMVIEGRKPEILDVIEIPLEDSGPDDGCQPENRLLKPGKWKKVGRITAQELSEYCEDDTVILHNHQKYVRPEFFSTHPKSEWRSLQLVHNTNVRFSRAYDPNKWRVSFRDGKGHALDLKLTDPVISDRLRTDEKVRKNCILTVSLATPWKPDDSDQPERCYKLVAGVVEL